MAASMIADAVQALRAADGAGPADENALEYLQQVLEAGDAEADDVRELLQAVLEREVTEDEFTAFAHASGHSQLAAQGAGQKEDAGPAVLTAEQRARLNLLEGVAASEDASAPPPVPPDAPSATGDPQAKKSGKGDKRGKAAAKAATAAEGGNKDHNRAGKERDKKSGVVPPGEGQFWTARFRRFHQTWMNKDQWKLQDHAMVDAVEELDDDDYSTAWLECLRLGIPWGGRGAGGRGVQRVTGETQDVWIPNVTLARSGEQILLNATLRLSYGKRYCLTGRNGCGKTTLLRRIARGALPGWPPWLRVQYVEQHIKGSDLTPVEYVLRYDFERTRLINEEQELLGRIESASESDEPPSTKLGEAAQSATEGKPMTLIEMQERLSAVYERLDQIEAWEAESRAEAKLREMGFTDELLSKTTSELSGGWKMRCCLCGTLLMDPDVLLLDEPTNALDVLGVEWLKQYLGNRETFGGTVLLVSHDRAFINAVTDELIVMRKKQFAYFDGTYDEYRLQLEKKRLSQTNKLAALDKRKAELKGFIETQQRASRDRKSKGGDPKKQKQIRSRKKKLEKMDQHGFGLDNGRKFKQSVHGWYGVPAALDMDEKPLFFKFPECNSPAPEGTILMQLDAVSFGWTPENVLVSGFNAQVNGKCRIGMIGPNGVGKSTLIEVLTGRLKPQEGSFVCSLPDRAIGVIRQDLGGDLDQSKSAVELILAAERGPATVDCQTEDSARVYLGTFGLGGDLSLRPIGSLSGGQRARVVFALESYSKPQLMILDEPTSHLDLESIDVLAGALTSFNGAAIVVSHDVQFIADTCNVMWVFDPKTKTILTSYPAAGQASNEFVAERYAEFVSRNFE